LVWVKRGKGGGGRGGVGGGAGGGGGGGGSLANRLRDESRGEAKVTSWHVQFAKINDACM